MTLQPPSVRIADRLAQLMGDDELTEDVVVTYNWNRGFERLVVQHDGGGEYNYSGVYHPDGVCEGGGVCRWCGRTLEFG